MTRVGERIRTARADHNARVNKEERFTLQGLGDAVSATRQTISHFEHGDRLPALDLLVSIHEQLSRGESDGRIGPLAEWIVDWVHDTAVARLAGYAPSKKQDLDGQIREALKPLEDEARRQRRGHASTLEDFPHGFEPLTVICGDRRETDSSRVTLADLFIDSFSITDLAFLPLLQTGGPLNVYFDKIVPLMGPAFLRRTLGQTNLLVIGSPTVNWAARMVNSASPFRFEQESWRKWDRKLRSQSRLRDQKTAGYFAAIVRAVDASGKMPDRNALAAELGNPDPEKLAAAFDAAQELLVVGNAVRKPSSITSQFRGNGLVDPISGEISGRMTHEMNDFGVVSLAPNPFDASGRRVAVLAAGIHGGGTMHALKLLLEHPERFADRPLGGVVEVTIPHHNGDWPLRLQQGECNWLTGRYTVADLRRGFGDALGQGRRQRNDALRQYEKGELQACLDFVSLSRFD